MEVSDQSQSDGGEVAYKRRTSTSQSTATLQAVLTRKRSIRKKAGKFVVRDGEMFFKKRKGKVIEL